jgi:hypothetical protein
VIPVDELDDDGLFGIEMMVQAAGQDAACVGDVRK